jgi:hypothetical protein
MQTKYCNNLSTDFNNRWSYQIKINYIYMIDRHLCSLSRSSDWFLVPCSEVQEWVIWWILNITQVISFDISLDKCRVFIEQWEVECTYKLNTMLVLTESDTTLNAFTKNPFFLTLERCLWVQPDPQRCFSFFATLLLILFYSIFILISSLLMVHRSYIKFHE